MNLGLGATLFNCADMERTWSHPELVKKIRACRADAIEAVKTRQLQKASKIYTEGILFAEAVCPPSCRHCPAIFLMRLCVMLCP